MACVVLLKKEVCKYIVRVLSLSRSSWFSLKMKAAQSPHSQQPYLGGTQQIAHDFSLSHQRTPRRSRRCTPVQRETGARYCDARHHAPRLPAIAASMTYIASRSRDIIVTALLVTEAAALIPTSLVDNLSYEVEV